MDEAQYWDWSRALAFGYYSKPPLIGWLIALTGPLCGAGEACVRLPSPILHAATALMIGLAGRSFYDDRTGITAALLYALAPGVAFSARIISTDVPLLFCFATALFAFGRLRAGGSRGDPLLLGLALGFGLLAKYAMVYFLGCALVAAVLDPASRGVVTSRRFVFSVVIGLAIVAPNLLWNLDNGFATFRHTGDNIRGGGFDFDPSDIAGFLAAQFGIIGPFVFAALLVAAVRAVRRTPEPSDRVMLAFSLPILAAVCLVAFAVRAHANWGATALVATVILAAALLRRERPRLVAASLLFGLVAQGVLFAADAAAPRVTLPFLARGDIYRPVLGWPELARRTAALAAEHGVDTVVAANRTDQAELTYYLRDATLSVLAWPGGERPSQHFELTRSLLDRPAPERLLFISACEREADLAAAYLRVTPLAPIVVATGPTTERVHLPYLLEAPRGGVLMPLPGC
nr:glycosyltransferase family 39 protein [Prosthecomicrobium pneumaticum]